MKEHKHKWKINLICKEPVGYGTNMESFAYIICSDCACVKRVIIKEMTQPTESWDKIREITRGIWRRREPWSDYVALGGEYYLEDMVIEKIKSFISTEIEKARQEGYKNGWTDAVADYQSAQPHYAKLVGYIQEQEREKILKCLPESKLLDIEVKAYVEQFLDTLNKLEK